MPKTINLSASRGAKILGLSKWGTVVDAFLEINEQIEPGFCEKNGYKTPEFEYNSAMKWGHAAESAVIELAENQIGKKIGQREKLFTHENGFVTCHIDGRYNRGPIHEGKTTNIFGYSKEWGEPGTDQIPVDVQIQVQHQMMLTGISEAVVSVLVWPKRVEEWEGAGWEIWNYDGYYSMTNDQMYSAGTAFEPKLWIKSLSMMGFFHQYHVNANKNLHKHMLFAYTQFWHKHILEKIEPKPADYEDVKKLITAPKGTIIAGKREIAIIQELQDIKAEISPSGVIGQRKAKLQGRLLDIVRKKKKAIDIEAEKYQIVDSTGMKLASYSEKGGLRV